MAASVSVEWQRRPGGAAHPVRKASQPSGQRGRSSAPVDPIRTWLRDALLLLSEGAVWWISKPPHSPAPQPLP